MDGHSYIIIRNDLTNSQKAVQSAHVAWEASKYYEHPSLVLVVVKNEHKLKKVMNTLGEKGIKFQYFRESDLNGEVTAICTEPVKDIQYLKRFQLLGGNNV